MEEFTNIHYVALWGFGIAAVFGFFANKTHFCAMGAISDLLHMGSKGRLGAWMLAAGVAMVGAQGLHLLGYVDLGESMYVTAPFGWLGYVVGGLLFGIGMTLGAGCGQRNLVRFGGGNLKALVVLLVMGISAYMTVRGLLGLVRINYIEPSAVDLTEHGLANQGLVALMQSIVGTESEQLVRGALTVLIGALLVGYALKHPEVRRNLDNLLAGLVIGATIVAGWLVTGYLGVDDFDPVPVESLSFIAPTGNTINYLMAFTGSTINFGVAVVFGMIVGSFVYAVLSGNFRVETFSNRPEMVGHLVGAVLMGFGGVLSLGCTIGQGVTGVSTLAMGSFIAVFFIALGSALTMRVQYHLLDDERGTLSALPSAIMRSLLPEKSEVA